MNSKINQLLNFCKEKILENNNKKNWKNNQKIWMKKKNKYKQNQN